MLATPLALVLAVSPASPSIWIRVDIAANSPCSASALVAAIRVQRPDASILLGPRPGTQGIEADFTESAGTYTLSVRGAGKPLDRVLPTPGSTCEETLETAALMIDRYADELHADAGQPQIEDLGAATKRRFWLFFGPSLVQAPAGLSFGLTLEVDWRLSLLLLSLGGEANLAQEEAVASFDGAFRLTPAATWLAAGVAPRLGPGRIVAQASFGLSLLWVDIQSFSTPPLPHQRNGNAVDPYVGLRVAYVLDLPLRFSLALRFEERFVPAPTSFFVEGYPGSVSVRSLSGDLALLAGYSFF
jgi:hypothetical protein